MNIIIKTLMTLAAIIAAVLLILSNYFAYSVTVNLVIQTLENKETLINSDIIIVLFSALMLTILDIIVLYLISHLKMKDLVS